MRRITRTTAIVAMVAAMVGGASTSAYAQSTAGMGIQGQGEVACGYDYGSCVRQWYDYGFVKNYIVSKIYYREAGYHFTWWN